MSMRRVKSLRRWTRELRPMFALALPIMAGMVGQMLMGLADTIMVGRVGVVPLAAAAFVNAVAHLPLIFGIGLLSSVAVLASQAFGAGKKEEAGEVLRHGVAIAAVTGILAALSMAALLPFLGWFGQPPDVIAAAKTYMLLFSASILPALLAQTFKQFSEALNHPWMPTVILLGGVAFNVLLNWILIYGNWGAPALGLEGAGWATLIARSAMLIGLALYVLRSPALRLFRPLRWWIGFQRDRFRRLLTLGWPVATQHLLEVSAFAFAALMTGWISADAMAAHQIAITCAATTFMFPLGLGMAVCIRVGQAWGAEQYERMRRIGFLGLGLAVGIMGVFGLLFVLGGELLAGFFIESRDVVRLAAQLLLIAAIFQVADGLQIVAISALRGLSDVRVPALVAVMAYWILAVPFGAALAFVWDQGATGIWIGLATGLGVAAISLVWRFHQKTVRSVPRLGCRLAVQANTL
jgi:multidrug resistance protein, MATE family